MVRSLYPHMRTRLELLRGVSEVRPEDLLAFSDVLIYRRMHLSIYLIEPHEGYTVLRRDNLLILSFVNNAEK